jgi:hypothetical protein
VTCPSGRPVCRKHQRQSWSRFLLVRAQDLLTDLSHLNIHHARRVTNGPAGSTNSCINPSRVHWAKKQLSNNAAIRIFNINKSIPMGFRQKWFFLLVLPKKTSI